MWHMYQRQLKILLFPIIAYPSWQYLNFTKNGKKYTKVEWILNNPLPIGITNSNQGI